MMHIQAILILLITGLCFLPVYTHWQSVLGDKRLESELGSCRFASIGVVTNYRNYSQVSGLSRWTMQSEKRMKYFDFRENEERLFQTWIRDAYVRDDVTDFVVLVSDPEKVLERVDGIFRNESYGYVAALPHRSRWLVFVWTDEQFHQVKDQQYDSALDNVAVVYVTPNLPCQDLVINQIWTFVWKKNRTKNPERIEMNALGKSCALFPNPKYGLNGRRLKVTGHAILPSFLHTKTDPVTGRVEYSGILIQCIHAISQMMNFTYDIWPPANQIDNWTLEEFLASISERRFHIGLSHFDSFYTMTMSKNISVSMPYIQESITGVYKKSVSSCKIMFFYKSCPMPLVYSAILALNFMFLLTTTTLFFIAVYVIYSPEWQDDVESQTVYPSECQDESRHRTNNIAHTQHSISSYCTRKAAKSSYCSKQCTFNRQCIYKYLHTMACFWLTTINQGTLPNARPVSGRILVSFWGFLTICLNSLFTSSITAYTVKGYETNLPFQTFPEMISRGDYSWGIVESSIAEIALNVIVTQTEEDSFRKLHEHAYKIVNPSSKSVDEVTLSYLNSLPQNFVLISKRSLLEDWVKGQPHPGDYVIMGTDIVELNYALVFPKGSEINTLMTRAIIRIRQSGILKIKSLKRFQPKSLYHEEESGSFDILTNPMITYAVVMTVLLVAVSFLLLIIEIVVKKLQDKRVSKDITSNGQSLQSIEQSVARYE